MQIKAPFHCLRSALLALPLGLLLNCPAGIAKDEIRQNVPVYTESNGIIAGEAEGYFMQTKMQRRAFYVTSSETPAVSELSDSDPAHWQGASGEAYVEVLPDTRVTHDDRLIRGENFSPKPGEMAVLHYGVFFPRAGRYYVWVRAYSTGTEDNGLHVGIDGKWPANGQRLQWCEGKESWRWESRQRTEENHCGEPHKIYLDIDRPGPHVIQFSMREDGFEFDKWLLTRDRDFPRPTDSGPEVQLYKGTLATSLVVTQQLTQSNVGDGIASEPQVPELLSSPTKNSSPDVLQLPRRADGNGQVTVGGELKKWHKVTLDFQGPFAHEFDNVPNPFRDYRLTVEFKHSDGTTYRVPGYFAADGKAANTSAQSGTTWRTHFAPDRIGEWKYTLRFRTGKDVALRGEDAGKPHAKYADQSGVLMILASDKRGRDLRAAGRLRYVGKHYLQFAETGQYFLKFGADAPETFLAYQDFDGTVATRPGKSPLKSWAAHQGDWRTGDPIWGESQERGKGLIGAVNYLSSKGCNAFSFLTYNAGGDGDNVWPFVQRDDKLHYDCSKLDQWGMVFDHATQRGMYLHFKMQETENDDHRQRKDGSMVPESLDGGDLGTQRKLYCRELIARFAHNLALNWNLGEENTQSTQQQQVMAEYIAELDPYDHLIVVHTFPEQQDKVYRPLLGDASHISGASLQNSSLETTHAQTVKWVKESARAGKPWVVAFDESGSAAHGQCPDLGYQGFDGHDKDGEFIYTQHKVRKQTLWGTLMAGGAGNEYYFGYKFAENDLLCEDWRSRDQSWDYGRIAIEFFHNHQIPFWEMENQDELVGNPQHAAGKFCFAKPGEVYLVYLPEGGVSEIDLTGVEGEFQVKWFDPRSGGELQEGSVTSIAGRGPVSLGKPPRQVEQDWLAVIRNAH